MPRTAVSTPAALDVAAIRQDFPILGERIHGKPLVYLDNAATTQKPQAVIDRLSHFYAHENSNVHRAAHTLAARATDAYEAARDKVRAIAKTEATPSHVSRQTANETAPTKTSVTAQVASRLNQLRDTNFSPR